MLDCLLQGWFYEKGILVNIEIVPPKTFIEMKLMVVGSFKADALETFFVRYLRKDISQMETFPALDYFHDFYYQSLMNKVLFRLGISRIHAEINDKLRRKVDEFSPDIIWVFRGMEIFPETLKYFHSKGIKLVNFNPDHPFIYNRGTGNRNVRKSVSCFDMHLCYHRPLMQYIQEQYGIECHELPFGYELNDHTYETACQAEEIPRVAFIGTYDLIRRRHIESLLKAGIPVDVFGDLWESRMAKHPNLKIFGPVYGAEFWVKTRQYRIQLNVYKEHNVGAHNRRTFEVPCVGGIMLEPSQSDADKYFDPEQEMFVYRSMDDMVAKAKMLLSMSGTEISDVRGQARNRSLEGKYSYQDRTTIVLEAIHRLAGISQ